jgi:hypothetical protein
MEFVLAGFRQFDNIRRFYFDAVGEDRIRQQITVGADLNLIRRYKIPLQELPLLCRRLLEGQAKIETIMFSESDMVRYANKRAAEANALMEKRRAHRPPVSPRAGQAWRGSPAPKGER